MNPLLPLLLLALCHVVTSANSVPFRRLSEQENNRLLTICGQISSSTQRKIFNGTVVPATESVFTARVSRYALHFSGVMISPRHVISSASYGDKKRFEKKKENCVGEHYELSPEEARNFTVTVNDQHEQLTEYPFQVKKAFVFFGCSANFRQKSAMWLLELENDIPDSKLHRPICLLGGPSHFAKDSELMLYANGIVSKTSDNYKLGQRKTLVKQTECPKKYGNDLFCGVAENELCLADFGGGAVTTINNRLYLVALSRYTGQSVKHCNGAYTGKQAPLVLLPVSSVLDLFCEEIGLCAVDEQDRTTTPVMPTQTTEGTTSPLLHTIAGYVTEPSSPTDSPTTLAPTSEQTSAPTSETTTELPLLDPVYETITVNVSKPMLIGKECNSTGNVVSMSTNVGTQTEETSNPILNVNIRIYH